MSEPVNILPADEGEEKEVRNGAIVEVLGPLVEFAFCMQLEFGEDFNIGVMIRRVISGFEISVNGKLEPKEFEEILKLLEEDLKRTITEAQN
jgi:hypothetical protein